MTCVLTKVHSYPWQHSGVQECGCCDMDGLWLVYGWEAPRSLASMGGTTYCSLPDTLPSEYEQVKLDMELMQM